MIFIFNHIVDVKVGFKGGIGITYFKEGRVKYSN